MIVLLVGLKTVTAIMENIMEFPKKMNNMIHQPTSK